MQVRGRGLALLGRCIAAPQRRQPPAGSRSHRQRRPQPLPPLPRDCGGLLGLLSLPLSTSAQHCEVLTAVSARRLLPLALAALRRQRAGAVAPRAMAAPAPAHAAPRRALVAPQPAAVLWHGPDKGPAAHVPALALAPARAALDGSGAAAGWGPRGGAAPAAPGGATAALARSAAGVVLIRVAGSWATGVAVSPSIILTNAHLLPPGGGSNSGAKASSGGSSGEAVWVRVGGGGGAGGGGAWAAALLLHRFGGYLDLAVLRLEGPAAPRLEPLALAARGAAGLGTHGSSSGDLGGACSACGGACSGAPCGASCCGGGEEVFVVGHGLFGPRMGWGPSVTRGSLARRVRLPGGGGSGSPGGGSGSGAAGRDSMLIVTAAVHAGASGGALVDAGGRLLGLVTSNTRHHRGATLPRWSYAIAADELAPLWAWAAAAEGGAPTSGGSGGAAELRRLDADDAAGHRLWALKPPAGGDGARPAHGAPPRHRSKL
jgi:hypothetical protein